MKLNEKKLQSFALAELNTYDLRGLGICENKAVCEIQEDIVSNFDDLNSEETKKARLDYFKVAGVTYDDYSEKHMRLDENREIIYGIRNIGGNSNLPFINLIPNFEIESKEDALRIYENIKDDQRIFNPLYLCFHTNTKIDADFLGSLYMVATTKSLKEKKAWPNEKSISFKEINDDSYYEWYKNGYDDFHSEFPELKTKVKVNSSDIMSVSLEQSLLKYVEFNGNRVGLIAAEKSNFLGHTASYFNEIFISKKWKGKGLAKAIQRRFVEEFSEEDYVWGTIDSNNLPSYKTAYSNGRRPIRYECFINLN